MWFGITDNAQSGETVLRTLEFSLPTALQGHVDMVQPTTFFGFRSYKSAISGTRPFDKSAYSAADVDAVTGCSRYVDPTCLANLYSFSSAKTYTSGLMGIAGFL